MLFNTLFKIDTTNAIQDRRGCYTFSTQLQLLVLGGVQVFASPLVYYGAKHWRLIVLHLEC